MYKLDISQIKPISILPRQYNKLIAEVKDKGEMVFLKGNKPHVVLVDFDYWQKLMEKERKADEKDALEAIRTSEKDIKLGRTKPLRSFADL